MADLELHDGWVDAEVAAELPGLRLRWIEAPVIAQRSPAALQARLRSASDRLLGARAVTMRREAVPAAYRAFLRGVGVDPDVRRSPIEQAALERLFDGGYRSTGRVPDAVLLGLIETGVAVVAADAARLRGPLGIRPLRDGEALRGAGPEPLAGPGEGELVVADADGPVGVLLGDVLEPVAPGRATVEVRVWAVQVPGVPDLHVEEALWTVQEALGSV